MPRTPVFPCLWWLAGTLLVISACSHDSPRDNPLDPKLTPPVELQVALDDTAGTATLTWTRYEGQPRFAHYLVLRRQSGLIAEDSLETIESPATTTYLDTTLSAGIAYEYRVESVNAAGLAVSSLVGSVAPLSLPGAQIVGAAFDSRTATASLRWTAYRGPRFAAYRVLRKSGAASEILREIAEIADTTFIDSGLVGNERYAYAVDVVTNQDEEIAGPSVQGGIYLLQDSWELDTGALPATHEQVRLYGREAAGVAALITTRQSVRLLVHDADGSVVSELTMPLAEEEGDLFETRQIGSALLPDGHRLLAMADVPGGDHGMIRVDAQGSPVVLRTQLQLAPVPASLGDDGRTILGEVHLSDRGGYGLSSFRDLVLSSGTGTIIREDFSAFPESPAAVPYGDGDVQAMGGWLLDRNPDDDIYAGSNFSFRRNGDWLELDNAAEARRTEPAWQGAALSVEVATAGWAAIQLGGDSYSR